MSGARSPRPRPAAAVMPTLLGTTPSGRSIVNELDPLNVRELPHPPAWLPADHEALGRALERLGRASGRRSSTPARTNEVAMLGLIRQMVAPLIKGPAGLLGLNRLDVRVLGGHARDRRVRRARPYSKRPCAGRAGRQDPPTDPRPARWPGGSRVAVRSRARRQAPTGGTPPGGIRAGRLRRAGPGHDARSPRTRAVQAGGETGSVESLTGVWPHAILTVYRSVIMAVCRAADLRG
jgi:hypothetical protein